jgi:DNA-binding response OmpR family regulator
MTGPDLAKALQSENPILRVLLTSGSADPTVLEGLVPGSAIFLAKPFKPSELIDRAHEVLTRTGLNPRNPG